MKDFSNKSFSNLENNNLHKLMMRNNLFISKMNNFYFYVHNLKYRIRVITVDMSIRLKVGNDHKRQKFEHILFLIN